MTVQDRQKNISTIVTPKVGNLHNSLLSPTPPNPVTRLQLSSCMTGVNGNSNLCYQKLSQCFKYLMTVHRSVLQYRLLWMTTNCANSTKRTLWNSSWDENCEFHLSWFKICLIVASAQRFSGDCFHPPSPRLVFLTAFIIYFCIRS